MADFTDKTVFITGAAKGQGRAVALALAEEGANIIAFDLGEKIGGEAAEGHMSGGEEDGYGIWNQVLPTATKIDAPAELSAEEVFRLASETIANATDKRNAIMV